MRCPSCGKEAPLVYRGVVPTCTACGRARIPLSGSAVNVAGQPAKIGGSVARVFGWVVLAVGLAIALSVGALLQAIFPAGLAGWVIGLLIALASVGLGLGLLLGGKTLRASGERKEHDTRLQAVLALATHRGGVVRAVDVAHALAIPVTAADAWLTRLAKEEPDMVRLDVDDQGGLYYTFLAVLPGGGVRVAAGHAGAAPPPDVRVAVPLAEELRADAAAEAVVTGARR